MSKKVYKFNLSNLKCSRSIWKNFGAVGHKIFISGAATGVRAPFLDPRPHRRLEKEGRKEGEGRCRIRLREGSALRALSSEQSARLEVDPS